MGEDRNPCHLTRRWRLKRWLRSSLTTGKCFAWVATFPEAWTENPPLSSPNCTDFSCRTDWSWGNAWLSKRCGDLFESQCISDLGLSILWVAVLYGGTTHIRMRRGKSIYMCRYIWVCVCVCVCVDSYSCFDCCWQKKIWFSQYPGSLWCAILTGFNFLHFDSPFRPWLWIKAAIVSGHTAHINTSL